jgi:hypothetical protein
MKSRNGPIVLGIFLTVGFLLFAAWMIHPRWSEINNLKLNELGDFLAGLSSTLAFLWLIIAVLLQREELQEQRKELKLSNEALAQQATALRKQSDIMQSELDELKSDRSRKASVELVKRLCGELVSIFDELNDAPLRGVYVQESKNSARRILKLSYEPISGAYDLGSYSMVLRLILNSIESANSTINKPGTVVKRALNGIRRLRETCFEALASTEAREAITKYDAMAIVTVEKIVEAIDSLLPNLIEHKPPLK